jgi:hypothetical protein
MNSLMRLLTGVALTGAALTALNRTCPEWVYWAGLDFWKLPDLWQEYHDESRRLAEQDAENATLLMRLEARGKIVERTADGSMSLFEAASAFRALNKESGDAIPRQIRAEFPDCSDEECLCRQVILWTETDLRARGECDRATEVVARLKSTLDQHRSEGIPIVPPHCPR